MYVCICHSVTDRDIRVAARRGVKSMRELRETTGCAGSCGQCARMAKSMLDECHEDARPLKTPLFQQTPAFA